MSLRTHLTPGFPCDKPRGEQAEGVSLAAGLGPSWRGEQPPGGWGQWTPPRDPRCQPPTPTRDAETPA